jgi:hypothetical protein
MEAVASPALPFEKVKSKHKEKEKEKENPGHRQTCQCPKPKALQNAVVMISPRVHEWEI